MGKSGRPRSVQIAARAGLVTLSLDARRAGRIAQAMPTIEVNDVRDAILRMVDDWLDAAERRRANAALSTQGG